MKRILGWDIIRLLSFIAIAYFHYLYFCWYLLEEPKPEYSAIFHALSIYSRSISFSGFSILLLSSILWGVNQKLPSYVFLFFFLMASLGLSFMTSDTYFELSWDIYFLLFVGFLSLKLIKNKLLIGIIGFIFLWIPFWKLRSYIHMPDGLAEVLLGRCDTDNGDWPIFPWIGLIWFGYGIGTIISTYSARLNKINRFEFMTWSLFLFLSLFGFGPYFHTRIGPGFSCDMFTQAPYIFWSHIIWILFLIRISLLDKVQIILQNNSVAKSISNLMISKKFWAAYFIHFMIIQAFSLKSEQIRNSSLLGVSAFLLLLPLTELILRILFSKKIKSIFKKLPTWQS